MNLRGNRAENEDGIALVAAMLVMMVCTILVGATMAVAIHTSQRSGLDRNRSAALHAAEAGIEAALGKMSITGNCPTVDDTETTLPDQNLPTESYVIRAPLSCTAQGNAVIAATGYVPGKSNAVATVTLVAHVNRGQNAPSSGGTNGGYVFPDAIFTDGALTATAGTLSTFGLGGTVPNLTANGVINIDDTLGHLEGPVHGWSTVTLSGAQVGGVVVGRDVTIKGAGSTVLGDVTAAGALTLSSDTTVNGNVVYGTTKNVSGTITGIGPTLTNTTLPTKRPMPLFNYSASNVSEIGSLLGVGTSAVASCPGSGTGTYYDYPSGNCTYNPQIINGPVVIIGHGGTLTVNAPQTGTGQLYIVNTGGNVTINGTGSTLPVFAYASGTMTLGGGTFSGQVVGATVTVATPCSTAGDPKCTPVNMTFVPPATPMPDFSFPGGYSPPSSTAYPTTLAYQYQCAGATTC